MTAITGKVAITKRPGELAIHSMDMFNMTVPDLQAAEAFYKTFGLDVREEGNALGLIPLGRISDGHRLQKAARRS